MRLYLAVAVLMLALVAYAEAQDDGIQRRFNEFGETMSEFGRNVAEKAKNAAERIHNSDFAVNARQWFKTTFEKFKSSTEQK